MKKIIILLFAGMIGLSACKNFPIEHPDFDYCSGSFPYQFPVRNLILGDYIYDNSNDNAGRFVISAVMGGVYENKFDRKFVIEVDNTLCANLFFDSSGEPVRPMPSNYYSLSSNSELIIPKGKFSGGITVQLTDAFFNDPNTFKRTFAVPIRMISSNDVDVIITGDPLFEGADPRITQDWLNPARNFTIFAVKYWNEYQATHLYYGKSAVKNAGGQPLEEFTYQERYVEDNRPFVDLITTGRRQVETSVNINLRSSTNMPGSVKLVFDFNESNTCTISGTGSYTRTESGTTYTTTYVVQGTGNFTTVKAQTYGGWGNKDRNVINANYTVNVLATNDPNINSENTYTAEDVFVVRDRNVTFESYSPSVVL